MDIPIKTIIRVLLWGAIWGLVFGSVALGLVLWIDIETTGTIGNLTPPFALVIGAAASVIGLVFGAFVSMVRGWTCWQMVIILVSTSVLCALAAMRYSTVWPRNDSGILLRQLHFAVDRLQQSERAEEIFSFRPPRRAGNYEIYLAGEKTPASMTDDPSERLWVQYPEACGRIAYDAPKSSHAMSSSEYRRATCGGLLWGAGWTSISSWLNPAKVPLALKVEKAAGEATELVFRKRDGRIELVELR